MSQLNELVRSVEWTEDGLRILDQSLLPHQVEYFAADTIEQVWNAIHALKVRGAPAIGITAAYGLAIWALSCPETSLEAFLQELDSRCSYLASSRPTAVNLFWAMKRMQRTAARAADAAEAKQLLLEEAQLIQQEDEAVCQNIGEYALSLFQEGDTIMTHCNAGGIATSRYGTALAPFYLARERGMQLSVYANETRPVLQGARLTAWELQQIGIDVTLITDNMAAHTMRTKPVNAIIVGADRITANGDTANKIGTMGLAVLAKHFDIPFYVAAPISTIDFELLSGDQIPIEERAAEEITHIGGKRIAPENIQVFNPAFDVTPNELITAIITEYGILRSPYGQSIAALKK